MSLISSIISNKELSVTEGASRELEDLLQEIDRGEKKFNQIQHDSESRKEITKLFLKWYFGLIVGAFCFCPAYNYVAYRININLIKQSNLMQAAISPDLVSYLDVSNTVSIITTTLSSGVGFVIGYYFKNKGE